MDAVLPPSQMVFFMTIIHFNIQAVMGVFLLELKRGDRVAAEKVGIYLSHCLPAPFKFHSNCVQILFN